jgi:hypothetical protein
MLIMSEACADEFPPETVSQEFAMLRVVEAARTFLSYRDRMTTMGVNLSAPTRNLADAIDRDFLIFDFERSVQALREAVAAVPGLPPPEARDRLRRRHGAAA